jgi:hypothetical protein
LKAGRKDFKTRHKETKAGRKEMKIRRKEMKIAFLRKDYIFQSLSSKAECNDAVASHSPDTTGSNSSLRNDEITGEPVWQENVGFSERSNRERRAGSVEETPALCKAEAAL